MLHRAVVVLALVLTLLLGATETARFSDRAHYQPRDTRAGSIGAMKPGSTALPGTSASPAPTATVITVGNGVTATYQILASPPGVLTCRLSVRNTATAPRRWEIALVYPSSVRSLRTSWARGTMISTLGTGGRYTVTGRTSLAPGAMAVIWLQFVTGPQQTRTIRPWRCTVNGAPCTMA